MLAEKDKFLNEHNERDKIEVLVYATYVLAIDAA
jgi:hypothetical protein